MNGIKAIETVYNGYRFRSRLEARWAVFFDTLGIEYQYEPEGFDLGDGLWYLPDFYIPTWDTFVEIKGDRQQLLDRNQCLKWLRLNKSSGKKLIVFVGNIEPDIFTVAYLPRIAPSITRTQFTNNTLRRLGYKIQDKESIRDWRQINEAIDKQVTQTIVGSSTFCETRQKNRFLAVKCSHMDKLFDVDFTTIAYFPLNKHFSFPEAFSRDVEEIKEGSVILDKKSPPNTHATEATVKLFAAYNALMLNGQKLYLSKAAYTAARQARFEHRNGIN